MVGLRSVVAEEAQLGAAEERLLSSLQRQQQQSNANRVEVVEVGLLIGKLRVDPNSERGVVYGLVPTPPTDSGLPPCSSSSSNNNKTASTRKCKSSPPPPLLLIDTEWVAEHARHLSRMLLGGMHVVGVYVTAPEPSFKASIPILSQTVKAVAQAAADPNKDEALLIHLSYTPTRWISRVCSLTATAATSNLHPCHLNIGNPLSSLQTYTSTYNFHFRLPIFHETSNLYTFKDVLQIAVNCLTKQIKNAKVLIDGNLVIADSHCTSEGSHHVEILLPFMEEPSELCRTAEVVSVIVFKGSVSATAYLSSKASMSQAVSDIKGDIISSLQCRLDIINEELEFDDEETGGIQVETSNNRLRLHELRKSCDILFPKRVLIPWLPGIFICDYLKHSESFEDVVAHCKEMLSLDVSADGATISAPERDAQAIISQSFLTAATGSSASPKDHVKKDVNDLKVKGEKSLNVNICLTIFVLLLSVLVAYYVALSGKKTVVL